MMRSDFIIRLTKGVKNDILKAIKKKSLKNTKGGPHMDKESRKLLRLETLVILTSWLVFLVVFIIKDGFNIPAEDKMLAILFSSSLTAVVAMITVAIAAIMGKANLFATSIVAAGFLVAVSYFASFRFSFVALAVICLGAGWLILKMASSEMSKKMMKVVAISLTVEGLLVSTPMLLLIFK